MGFHLTSLPRERAFLQPHGLSLFVNFALLFHEDAETILTVQVLGSLGFDFPAPISRQYGGGGIKIAAATPPSSKMAAVQESTICGGGVFIFYIFF